MKLCKDCQHYTELGLCISPYNGISLVTGDYIPIFANVNRGGACGVHGNYFEKKIILTKRKWWQLWKTNG